MSRFSLLCLFTLLCGLGTTLLAADDDGGIEGVEEFPVPSVSASLAVGMNYDFFKNPLTASFTDSRGYFGVNIPFALRLSDEMVSEMTSTVSENFTDGDHFVPDVAVKQFANTTIQVDVPLFDGVVSFNHVRAININYKNRVSLPTVLYSPPDSTFDAGDDSEISMIMRASMNVPLSFSLGWETVSFGYLHRFDRVPHGLKASLTLTRHHAFLDINGNINMDMAGRINATISGQSTPEINLDYSDLHNTLDGYFSVERWTPTLAVQYWRFYTIARFGFKDKAKGRLIADYKVPFFVDPETFQFNDSMTGDNAANYLLDHIDDFNNNRVAHVNLSTDSDMDWEMPHGFTFGFEIVPEKLRISYSKFANSVGFSLVQKDLTEESDEFSRDTLDFRVKAHLDHLITLRGDFKHLFFTLGTFSFDVSSGEDARVIAAALEDETKDVPLVKFGDGMLMPVLNGGIIIGGRFQFMGEIDLMPFPSVKTGVVYNF